MQPQENVQLRVVAHFADGSSKDVSSLAVYDPVDRIATVDHDGRVERQAFGETTLIVRYLDRQVAVPLAFVPASPDFAWPDPPAANFVDQRVWENMPTAHEAV